MAYIITKITVDLQNGTDRTVYATWKWTEKNTKDTDHYHVKWWYATGDGVAFVGSDNDDVKIQQSVYTAPSNATTVMFKILPVAKKNKKKNGKKFLAFTGSWSTKKEYKFETDTTPEKPSAPSTTIEGFALRAELDTYDANTATVEFQVVKNDQSLFASGISAVITNHASLVATVEVGAEYKVRCRGKNAAGDVGEWSEYSENVGTIPATPTGFSRCEATSSTSVHLEWPVVTNATGYEIEYTTKKIYFDASTGNVQSVTVDQVVNYAEITGLDSGEEWYFRVRATNEKGESGWSPLVMTILGSPPAAPTTWSNTTTAIVGEDIVLYWVHNSEDGSSQTYAEIELTINGNVSYIPIANSTNENEKDKISSYHVPTNNYAEGASIKWRVRTKGIHASYGDWSIVRSITVYAPPTLQLSVNNNSGYLNAFPCDITAVAGPRTQTPIGYYLTVVSKESYETVDQVGKNTFVSAGDTIYAKHFDAPLGANVRLMPSDIDFENNVSYTVTCLVAMNSGLTAEASVEITIAWTEEEYSPDAEIGYDPDTITAYIRPYCEDEEGNPIANVKMAVYRREFDGDFTELATGIDSASNTFVTDPHPALNYARYRIVATAMSTGAISYYDPPGYPTQEDAVIIQWAEEWSNFATDSEDALSEPAWSGSLLRLPYNVDVSDDHKPDVTLVPYIGRKRQVSYYGTQLGETATWSMEILKNDEETLYALRRLAIWMGDVYIREPSGSGYWASISVSISQKHCALTIPVTISITRVEGGA